MKIHNTKHRTQLLQIFKNKKDSQLTVEELTEILSKQNLKIGIATVYRTLDYFEKNNLIRKFTSSDKTRCCYQYNGEQGECDNHFHLKCTNCGKLIHLDCESIFSLSEHIEKSHNFQIDIKETIIYGKCCNCKNQEDVL